MTEAELGRRKGRGERNVASVYISVREGNLNAARVRGGGGNQ